MGIQEILSMFNSTNNTPLKLDEKLVEYGDVYKFPILQNEILEISLLNVGPKSKVKMHTHFEDSEVYFFIKEKRYSACEKGGKHEICNTSDEWMQVLSIKTKFEK